MKITRQKQPMTWVRPVGVLKRKIFPVKVPADAQGATTGMTMKTSRRSIATYLEISMPSFRAGSRSARLDYSPRSRTPRTVEGHDDPYQRAGRRECFKILDLAQVEAARDQRCTTNPAAATGSCAVHASAGPSRM